MTNNQALMKTYSASTPNVSYREAQFLIRRIGESWLGGSLAYPAMAVTPDHQAQRIIMFSIRGDNAQEAYDDLERLMRCEIPLTTFNEVFPNRESHKPAEDNELSKIGTRLFMSTDDRQGVYKVSILQWAGEDGESIRTFHTPWPNMNG